MEFAELSAEGVIGRGGFEGGDFPFQGCGFWLDHEGLDGCDGQHDRDDDCGNSAAAVSGDCKADERDQAASQSPFEIAREKHPDNPTRHIPVEGCENGRRQNEGEQGRSPHPAGDCKTVQDRGGFMEPFSFFHL